MKRSTKIWIGVGVIVVAAVVAMVMVRSRRKGITEVTTGKVERKDLVSKVTASGKIEAKRKVDLSANVMGQIVNLAVREGDIVRKGDFLLQIDRAQLAASAAGAEASVRALLHDRDAARATAEEARLAFQRAKTSYADRVIPLAELDRARAALASAEANVRALDGRIEQARASLAGANDTLSKTTIRAPMDGIVTSLPVEEGEVAVIGTMNNPGTKLLTISDMSIVEAVMDVDETDVPNVHLGQKATVTVDAYPNTTFGGTVTELASSPQSSSTTLGNTSTEAVNFEVKIQLTNPPPTIRPGFSASADIITGSRQGVHAIPIQALVVRDKPGAGKGAKEEEGVYLFDKAKGIATFRPVTTGITGENLIEAVTGVKAGEEIVTGPFRALREIHDGSKVKVAKAEGPKGPSGGKG